MNTENLARSLEKDILYDEEIIVTDEHEGASVANIFVTLHFHFLCWNSIPRI